MESGSPSAYRVASLLRREDHGTDASSLSVLTQQIEAFLRTAPQVPAMAMEPEAVLVSAIDSTGVTSGEEARNASAATGESDIMVELNVVAGVLEPKEMVTGVDGMLLPTEATRAALEKRRVEEAQAMLNLMSALTCSSDLQEQPGDSPVGPMVTEVAAAEQDAESDSDDDDSEVVFMDGDALNAEDTSSDDEQFVPQRRRVVEIG